VRQLHRETRQAEEEEEEDDDDDDYVNAAGNGYGGLGHSGARRPTPGRQAAFMPGPGGGFGGGGGGEEDLEEEEENPAGYVEAMMRDAAQQFGGGSGLLGSSRPFGAAGFAPRGGGGPRAQFDPAGLLDDRAAARWGAAKKQTQASLRRDAAVAHKQHGAREANLRRSERLRCVARVRQAAALRRWELGQKLRADADRRRGADDLMAKVKKRPLHASCAEREGFCMCGGCLGDVWGELLEL
jgi:hypothetical protein